jgi:hypothetical protein
MEGSGENTQSLKRSILQLMMSFEQLRHAVDRDRHKGRDAKSWHLLTGKEEASARRAEQVVRQEIKSSHTDPPHDEIVWSCAHCRDLPVEEGVKGIDEVKMHITEEYALFLF